VPEVIHIIKNLKKLGYTIYLMSNIGEETMKDLKKKLPYEFSLFDQVQASLSTLNYLQKPSLDYYSYFSQNHLRGKKPIFVDDKKKNVEAVQQLGYVGIWYEDPKQLLRDLNVMRVFKGHSEFQQKQMETKISKKKRKLETQTQEKLIEHQAEESDSFTGEEGRI